MTKIQVRKQFTTRCASAWPQSRCFQYDEDTSSKAIHNPTPAPAWTIAVVFNMTKIQVRKQFTTGGARGAAAAFVVFNMTKIQVRKQFTTRIFSTLLLSRCFQYDEDTSSKAIHNNDPNNGPVVGLFSIWRRYKFESNSQPLQSSYLQKCVVFNMTKIQVRKQFTTQPLSTLLRVQLFSIWRRYKFESNSQRFFNCRVKFHCCFQYDEDTSSKAIHNRLTTSIALSVLFSIWRRYKFESNSQLLQVVRKTVDKLFSIWRRYKFESNSQQCFRHGLAPARCFQYDEDTSSKAIHNTSGTAIPTRIVVFNMTKIQVRKQFTTFRIPMPLLKCCFQYDEDTSSKAIHNLL